MKNTVYALARQGPVDPPEEFGERLARHFLDACPAARRAVLGLAVQPMGSGERGRTRLTTMRSSRERRNAGWRP